MAETQKEKLMRVLKISEEEAIDIIKRGTLGVVLERRPWCAVSHEVRRRGQ